MELCAFIVNLFFNEKIRDAIFGFLIDKAFESLYRKVMPNKNKIERAFKKALDKWSKNTGICEYHYGRRFQTIQDYVNYAINRENSEIESDNELFQLFEDELRKDTETYHLLLELKHEATLKGIDKIILNQQNITDKVDYNTALLLELKQKLSTFNKGKRRFEAPENYIQRTCSIKVGDNDFIHYYLNPQKYQTHPLLDFVLGNTDCKDNKYILYSDAQSGKTTELQKLGWDLQEKSHLIPILFEVKGHPQLLNDLPGLSEEQEGIVVLIIDALDERFDGDERYNLYNEIKTYAEEHPNLRIILSCRSNFGGENSLDNFVALTLNDLSIEDATAYISSKGCSQLCKEIEKKELYEFVRTPFYLMALVDYYVEKHELPNNKGDLYDYFICRRLNQEDEKKIKRGSNMKRNGYRTLQRMAIATQLLNVNDLSEMDVLSLEDENEKELDRVLHSGMLVETSPKRYAFIHNAFKEFLVSKYLFHCKDVNEIQELCCYKNTKTIKSTWYNTIALLLSQLPDTEEFSHQIVDWIVNDNKSMVLYVDSSMFNESQRSSLFKDIIEECKHKNLRFDDFVGTKYESLMNFGFSEETVLYLYSELENAETWDNHLVNILFLLRFISFELLPESQVELITNKLFDIFKDYIGQQEYAYILFIPFENPFLLNENSAKRLYPIIEDSENPDVIDHWIEYVVKVDCVEQYIDQIIRKGEFVHNYTKNGYTRIVSRYNLFEAYSSVNKWESIKKVLCQLIKDYKDHLYSHEDGRRDFDKMLAKMLKKAAEFCNNNQENTDFIYNKCLFEMGKDRYVIRLSMPEPNPYVIFFNEINKSQYYFEKSFEGMKKQFLDREHHEYKEMEAYAYCTSLFLNAARLDYICSAMEEVPDNSEIGYSLLSWLKEYSSQEMYILIDDKQRANYNCIWKKYHQPSPYDMKRQRDYDELMDYEAFRTAVVKVIDEKTPRCKQDLNKIRKSKIAFTDDEYERVNDYVFRFFYEFEQEDASFNLEAIRNSINEVKIYNRFIVCCMVDFIYSENRALNISEEQQNIFIDAANEWLEDLSVEEYDSGFRFSCPAISVLLHKDTKLRKDKLLKLLPYSSCKINHIDEMNVSHDFTLFDYIKEEVDVNDLVSVLSQYYSKMYLCHEDNIKLWGCYLVESSIVREYGRVVDWTLNMSDGHSSCCLIRSLLGNPTTKKLVMKQDVFEKYSESKKVFIYEQLAKDKDNDEFVRLGLEGEFEQFEEVNKERVLPILLSIGSMYGLKYFVEHMDMISFHTSMHYKNIEALPYLLAAYSKAIDMQSRLNYSFIMNSVEEIALVSVENWCKVKNELEKLIQSDRKKFVHLNYYLCKWEKDIMEKHTPVFNIDVVRQLLNKAVKSDNYIS